MSEYKLTPTGYDYGSRPIYNVEPIYHDEDDNLSGEESWECPNCGEDLRYSPTHDRYTEGYAPEAVPDEWTCLNCDYTWAE